MEICLQNLMIMLMKNVILHSIVEQFPYLYNILGSFHEKGSWHELLLVASILETPPPKA